MDDFNLGEVLPPRPARYGQSEPFALGAPLRYADFDLIYRQSQIDGAQRTWMFDAVRGDRVTQLALRTGGVVQSAHLDLDGASYSLDLELPESENSRITVHAL